MGGLNSLSLSPLSWSTCDSICSHPPARGAVGRGGDPRRHRVGACAVGHGPAHRVGHVRPARPHGGRRLPSPRGDLRGEPLLRQPLRHLGDGRRRPGGRPRRRPRRRARPRSPRTARRTPACCRTTSTSPPRRCGDLRRRGHGVPASAFVNQPFSIDDYIGPTDNDLPGARRLRPRTASRRAPGARPAAAPGTWCTASTRSSTRSTAASRTATSPAPTRSG